LRFSPKARVIADALFRSHGPQRALDQSRLATACGAHPSAKHLPPDAKTAETENGGTDIAAPSQKTHQRPPYGLASLTQGPFRANPALNRLIARKRARSLAACCAQARGSSARMTAPDATNLSASRHRTPGDLISECPGDFVGIRTHAPYIGLLAAEGVPASAPCLAWSTIARATVPDCSPAEIRILVFSIKCRMPRSSRLPVQREQPASCPRACLP
jgi:hypothetical protein